MGSVTEPAARVTTSNASRPVQHHQIVPAAAFGCVPLAAVQPIARAGWSCPRWTARRLLRLEWPDGQVVGPVEAQPGVTTVRRETCDTGDHGPERAVANQRAPVPIRESEAGMNRPPEEQRYARAQRARQVLGGNEIDPPQHPLDLAPSDGIINRTQMLYLIVLAVLVIVAIALYFTAGAGVASPVLFVLALALFLGWIIF